MAHILRIRDICDRKGECRSTYYNRIRDGLWPKPIALGPRLVGMPDYEFDAMIAAQVAGRSTKEIKALVFQLIEARKTADQREEKRTAVSSTTESAEKLVPQFGSPRGPRKKLEHPRGDAKQKVRARRTKPAPERPRTV